MLVFSWSYKNSCFVYLREKERVEREEEVVKAKEGVFRGIPLLIFA